MGATISADLSRLYCGPFVGILDVGQSLSASIYEYTLRSLRLFRGGAGPAISRQAAHARRGGELPGFGGRSRAVGVPPPDDRTHSIKAVLVVHNETATGVTSDIGAVRRAIDAARHLKHRCDYIAAARPSEARAVTVSVDPGNAAAMLFYKSAEIDGPNLVGVSGDGD